MFRLITDVNWLKLKKYVIRVGIISNILFIAGGLSVFAWLYYSGRINTYQPVTVRFENNEDAGGFRVYGISSFGRKILFQKVSTSLYRSYYSFYKRIEINPPVLKNDSQVTRVKLVIGDVIYNYRLTGNKTFVKPETDRGKAGLFPALISIIHWTLVRTFFNLYIVSLFFIIIALYYKKGFRHIKLIKESIFCIVSIHNQRYNNLNINSIILFHALSGIIISFILLAPGLWGGDALNAYIQGVTGKYASAQPVFLAFICSLTHHLYQGALPVFLGCISLYFLGFSFFLFHFIHNRARATLLFYILCFYPPLIANIGVVQTETIQIGVLSAFIPLTILLYYQKTKFRWLLFLLLSILLCCFSLVRYDTLPVTLALAYWLAYALFRKHCWKGVVVTAGLVILFHLTGLFLNTALRFNKNCKEEMRNAILTTDIAAISVQCNVNYIPACCWKTYLLSEEKNLNRIHNRGPQWKDDFFSYLFNIDPSIGVFTYNTTGHSQAIIRAWIKAVTEHPFVYFRVRLKNFITFLCNYNFNQSFESGIRYNGQNLARLAVGKSDSVHAFLTKHGNRFKYDNGDLILYKDETPVTAKEKHDLQMLVSNKRHSDVDWMEHYSRISSRVYTANNSITHYILEPYFEIIKKILNYLLSLFLCFICLLISVFFRKKIKHPFLRFSFLMLCFCGIVNILQRFFTITDPIFRFGMISVIFLFFSFIILGSGFKETSSTKNE